MTIDVNKNWCDTRINVSVNYIGICDDGSLTSVQSCYLPWDGESEIAPADLIDMAQGYFDAKYHVGSDRVLSAKLHDRGDLAPIGEDAVNAIFLK